jgi:predicted dehydrogenase
VKRRSFLKAAAAGAAPMFVPSHVFGQAGRPGANDRIKVGLIGFGGRARWLMQYIGDDVPDAELVAVADCYLPRTNGRDPGGAATAMSDKAAKWAKYQYFQKMFEKEKLDAVFVETTCHARVWCAIHALQAGLDVYAEKPIALTVEEGRALVNATRKYNRILQAGSQQRSMPINRYASELVRTGKIGPIQSVIVCNYLPGLHWTPQPGQPVPEGMDWDLWCNQTELRPYHPSLQHGWANYVDYDGGGESWGVSGWGTHGLDQVQCALGMDDTGPVELWTEDWKTIDRPNFSLAKSPMWQPALGRKPIMMRFATGTVVRLEEPCRGGSIEEGGHDQLGGIFVGTDGVIKIIRGNFSTNRPELLKDAPPPTKEGRGEDLFHLKNFFECLRTRQKPNADVETAHRATSLCHLANICRQLDRRLRWDPKAEKFIGDDEANKLLSRPRRKGFELPV